MSEREIQLVDLGALADLVDGRAGRQFDVALQSVIDAAISEEAQRDGGGWAKGSVLLTVTIEARSEEDGGSVSIAVAVESKPPKMRASGAVLTRLGGSEYGIDVTPSPQARLPFSVSRDEKDAGL